MTSHAPSSSAASPESPIHTAGAMRYLLWVLCGIAIAVGLWGALFFSVLGSAYTENARRIASWYARKTLPTGEEGRILLVGGSNVLFGMSAKQISEATGRAAVNFGTHAALNLDYLLSRVERVARPGDAVVLCLEYEHYQGEAAPNSVFIEYILGADPSYFYRLPWEDKVFWFLAPSFRDMFVHLLSTERHKREDRERIEQLAGEQLNPWGDRYGHEREKMSDRNKRLIAAAQPLPAAQDPGLVNNPGPRQRIENFIAWCRAHDVRVFAAFPNTIRFPEYESENSKKFFRNLEAFYRGMDVPLLEAPEDSLMDPGFFFDTVYHPNQEGMTVRTQRLIPRLQEQLSRPAQ